MTAARARKWLMVKWGATTAAVVGFLVCASLAVLDLRVLIKAGYPIAGRMDSASHELLDCTKIGPDGKKHGNPNCLPSMVEAIGGSARATAGAIAKAAPEISSSLKGASAESVVASRQSTAHRGSSGNSSSARALLRSPSPRFR